MASKKRGGKREAAFTDATVLSIRKMAKEGKSIAEIAEKYKARYDTVGRVVNGLSYRRLLPDFKKPEKDFKKPEKKAKKKAA